MRLRTTSARGTGQLELPRTPGRRCGAGRVCGDGALGHSAPAWVDHARVVDRSRQRRGVRARGAPQRVAEGDHGDAVREGQEPVEGVRQHGEQDGDDAADGEEHGRPAGEDAGPEQRDAEDEAAGQAGEALDLEDGLQQADVALDRAVGRRGEDVVDVAGVGVGERREDVGGDRRRCS